MYLWFEFCLRGRGDWYGGSASVHLFYTHYMCTLLMMNAITVLKRAF